jgi:hypothetical protein
MAGNRRDNMSAFVRFGVVAVIGCWLLSPGVGAAGEKQDPVGLLMRLEGTWEVDLGGTGSGQKATCRGKKIAGGKGVYTFFKRPTEKGDYEAHAIWTFDLETKKIYVYEINSYGEVFEHVGNFRKDGTLSLVRQSRKGKRVTIQKTLMTWKSADEIVSKIDEKQKGKWETFTFTFKRSGK